MIPAVTSRKTRFAFVTILMLVAAAATVLFVTPPTPVLRLLVKATSMSLMTGHETEDGRVTGAAKRLLRGYVQTSFAAHVAQRAVDAGGSDEEILGRMMLAARQSVLYPRERTRYDPKYWPALVAGIGYCDQTNGAVCLMAARYFEKSELIALYSAKNLITPHSVGRVWSKRRGEWLYFDAFYETPVIYTRAPNGKANFIASHDRAAIPARPPAPAGIYELPGWRISDFPRTFGAYMMARLRPEPPPVRVAAAPAKPEQKLEQKPKQKPKAAPLVAAKPAPPQSAQTRSAEPRSAPPRSATAAPVATPAGKGGMLAGPVVLAESTDGLVPMVNREDRVYRRIARAYMAARIDHLLGSPDRDAYRAIASDAEAKSDDRAAEVAAAAKRFAESGF